MNKKEFIDKFVSSKNIKSREGAAILTMGAVKFHHKKNVSFKKGGKDYTLDFCEVCSHPKGTTINSYEFATSFEGIDIRKLIKDFKSRSESYLKKASHEGQLRLNLVIPPEPKMIMELGKHIDDMMESGDFTVNIYDPKRDKCGACLISEGFFESLREDPAYESMSIEDTFTTFLIDFVEML